MQREAAPAGEMGRLLPRGVSKKAEEAGLNHFLLLRSNQSVWGKELLVSPDKGLLVHGHLILLPYLIETTLNPSFSRLTCFLL